jgi:hypothetical protein
MSLSTEGSVAAWEVTFHLDGDESLHAAISIRLAGPPTHHEARQKALKILQGQCAEMFVHNMIVVPPQQYPSHVNQFD